MHSETPTESRFSTGGGSEPLQVTEIYASIQGESSYMGFPCTFVRLTGCPLRCRWCDTTYAFEGGEAMDVDAVVARVAELGQPYVELTGGEPLAQVGSYELLRRLVADGKNATPGGGDRKVLIETSGSECIEAIDPEVHIIMDLKAPASKMVERNKYSNIEKLKRTDEVKFVIAKRADLDWAMGIIREFDLAQKAEILWSPAFGLVKPAELVDWILEVKAPGRFQLQSHKYIWHPRQKGV